MKTECTMGKLEFQRLGRRRVEAAFDGGVLSSDGGALLLREVEERSGIIRDFCRCLTDHRDPGQVEHQLEELVRQRVFALCLGYEDLNDHEELRTDPVLAAAVGKSDPSGRSRRRQRHRGQALASPSTLSRLEHAQVGSVGENERYHRISFDEEAIERFFVRKACELHRGVPEVVVIDLDPTDVELHGKQEERFFHGYYNEYCYLPMYAFVDTDALLGAWLRPASVGAAAGLCEYLAVLLEELRLYWPEVQVIIRGDSDFSTDELMSFIEERKAGGGRIDYLFGLSRNSRLLGKIRKRLEHARRKFLRSGETTAVRVFGDFFYRTRKSWSRKRRVVAKAEHLEKGANPRFVVTSLPKTSHRPRELYELHYCARGEAENRIKEQQLHLFSDRLSCSSFVANQFRLWLSALAFMLMSELRRSALVGTVLERATCQSIRLKLLKIGARVRLSVRRLRLSLPTAYPGKELFYLVLQRLRRPSSGSLPQLQEQLAM